MSAALEGGTIYGRATTVSTPREKQAPKKLAAGRTNERRHRPRLPPDEHGAPATDASANAPTDRRERQLQSCAAHQQLKRAPTSSIRAPTH
jgi:hypothetical protein